MKPKERYRFKVLNTCDGAFYDGHTINLTFTGGQTLIDIYFDDTTGIGDIAWLTGFDDSINGLQNVQVTSSTNVRVVLNYTYTEFKGYLHGDLRAVSWRYVSPLNFYKCKYDYQKDNNQIFFRKNLEGKLRFSGATDWPFFKDVVLENTCCPNLLWIEKLCNGSWVVDYKGVFAHNDCEWDLSHCWVDVELQTDDLYTCLLSNTKEDVNILPELENNTVTITPDISIEEVTCCQSNVDVGGFSYLNNDDSCPSVLDFTYFIPSIKITNCTEGDINSYTITKVVIDNVTAITPVVGIGNLYTVTGDLCTSYQREVIVTLKTGLLDNTPVQGSGNAWIKIDDITLGGYPATKWGRVPTGCIYDVGAQLSSVYDETTQTWTSLGITCYHFEYIPPTCYTAPDGVAYDSGRLLSDAIFLVANRSCGGITSVVSDFFEINPPGDTPGYVAGTNYVTGATNKLANMLIYQLTDVVEPTADTPAVVGNLNWSQIQQMLLAFNAYWFVNANGELRIEHISWFRRTAVIDITSTDCKNNLYNRGLKKFSFDKLEIPGIEKFSFMYSNGADFTGLPIKYSSVCANSKNVSEFNIGPFMTDVDMIMQLPTLVGTDGFVLICVDPSDNSIIDREAGIITGTVQNNAHLSWANLHNNYHRHNRPLISGNMNGTDQTFITAKPSKRQKNARYLCGCCATIEPLTDLITTELGDGIIDKMTFTLNDLQFDFELLF